MLNYRSSAMQLPNTSVTGLLAKWRNGDNAALGQLTPLIYAELRRLARGHLRRERQEHTLQPTALVHEAYLRLAGEPNADWESRAHFLAVASEVMRQVLVDHSRRHNAAKRGGGLKRAPLDENTLAGQRSREILALDEALAGLAEVDPVKSRLIELRHFGGLTAQEIACVLNISTATITREMRMAEAWLARQLRAK